MEAISSELKAKINGNIQATSQVEINQVKLFDEIKDQINRSKGQIENMLLKTQKPVPNKRKNNQALDKHGNHK